VARMLILALLATGAAIPALAADITEPDLMKAAVSLAHDYDTNYGAKNADGMTALYTPDAVLVSPGPVVHGSAALRQYYQARFASGAKGHATQITEVHVMGDGGYGVGQFSVTVPDAAGHLREERGNLATVYQHGEDGWHLRLVVASVAHDPHPAAATRPAYDEPVTDR
jgi:uncharacterized protein (TIGR02246 family)